MIRTLFAVAFFICALAPLTLVSSCCDDSTVKRYTLCAGGPVDPADAPFGAVEVWIGDGDITCWQNGAPYTFREMSVTETPESACEFCEGAAAR